MIDVWEWRVGDVRWRGAVVRRREPWWCAVGGKTWREVVKGGMMRTPAYMLGEDDGWGGYSCVCSRLRDGIRQVDISWLVDRLRTDS